MRYRNILNFYGTIWTLFSFLVHTVVEKEFDVFFRKKRIFIFYEYQVMMISYWNKISTVLATWVWRRNYEDIWVLLKLFIGVGLSLNTGKEATVNMIIFSWLTFLISHHLSKFFPNEFPFFVVRALFQLRKKKDL